MTETHPQAIHDSTSFRSGLKGWSECPKTKASVLSYCPKSIRLNSNARVATSGQTYSVNRRANVDANAPGERRKKNQAVTEQIIDPWCEQGPAGFHRLFRAILEKAAEGPIATPERAKVILPTLA